MVSPSSTPQPPLRVALLLYPGCMPAGLFAAADMARAANLRAQASVMDICWAGVDRSPVPTWQGAALAPTVALQQAEANVVLVPGLWLSSPDQLPGPLQQLAPVVQALRALPRRTQLWSYCAGVVLAAELTFGTAAADLMECVGGACEYKLDGTDAWVKSGPGEKFSIPANSKFDIRVTEAYHYICHYA